MNESQKASFKILKPGHGDALWLLIERLAMLSPWPPIRVRLIPNQDASITAEWTVRIYAVVKFASDGN